MYEQVYDPIGAFARPIGDLRRDPAHRPLLLLGGFWLRAHWAALISLAVALLVAIIVYSMPPIMWMVAGRGDRASRGRAPRLHLAGSGRLRPP